MKINVRDVYQGITSLVFPEICLICNQVFEKVCSSCEYRWLQNASSFRLDDLTISAVVTYDSESSGVVLKAKEDRNRVARSLMASALASLATNQNIRIKINQLGSATPLRINFITLSIIKLT